MIRQQKFIIFLLMFIFFVTTIGCSRPQYTIKELDSAIEKGDIVKVKEILTEDPSLINAKNDDGKTLLHIAGLDIHSSIHLRLQLVPAKKAGIEEMKNLLDQTIMVLEKRFNELGISEPIIQKQGDDSIIVNLPEVQDLQAVIEIVQKTALLEFKEQSTKDPSGWKTVMTGDKIKNAQASLKNGPYVSFELTPDGARQFAEITKRNIEKPVAIYFDGELISAPVVKDVISDGTGRITMGGGDKEKEDEALALARYLRAGALPVPLKIVENKSVKPVVLSGNSKELIELLIDKGVDINAKDKYGITPLQCAAQTGSKELVELLIDKGADINAKDNYGRTPLHRAVEGGTKEVVELLIDKGADINAKNKNDMTALDIAKKYNYKDIVNILIKTDNDKTENNQTESNQTDNTNETVDNSKLENLFNLAEKGDIAKVKAIVEKDPNMINAKDSEGSSVLYYAVRSGSKELVEYLIGKGADVNAEDTGNDTALHCAAWIGSKELVEYLIGKGADINAKNAVDMTVLHFATLSGSKELVEYLVGKGADINAKDKFGLTVLHYASKSKNASKELVGYLLAKGLDINARDKTGETPLHYAAINKELVKYLIGKGADINAKDNHGNTLLYYALFSGSKELLDYLLGKGLNVNAKDSGGKTILHNAVEICSTEVVEYLVSKGADINAKDSDGKTVLHTAAADGSKELVEYLVGKGAGINAKNSNGETPLKIAKQRDYTDIVEYLISKGAKE